eukprot:750700-Hanusia_phi.AAC.2
MKHVKMGREKHESMVRLQSDILRENARLHTAAQSANEELKRSSHINRDLEYSNQKLREENDSLHARIAHLMETVTSLRSQLREHFEGSQHNSTAMRSERTEWERMFRTLETQNEELQRRVQWLENIQRR